MMRTFSEAVAAIGSSAELLVVVRATVAVLLGLAAVRMAQHGRTIRGRVIRRMIAGRAAVGSNPGHGRGISHAARHRI